MVFGQEIDPADVNQLKAACELALQRMALYNEDATEASTLTKPSRGSKDWPCIYHQHVFLKNIGLLSCNCSCIDPMFVHVVCPPHGQKVSMETLQHMEYRMELASVMLVYHTCILMEQVLNKCLTISNL